MRGQDLLTLLALPFLALTAAGASRGSAHSTLVWIGLLGYVLYTYTGAAFAYRFNRFFLLYLALFSLSLLALVTAVKLWRASPWGDLLAGCLLIKSLSMGLALLCMTWFSTQAGKPLELGLTVGYAVMTLGASFMSLWFFRHFREPDGLVEQRLAPHG